MAHCMVSRGCLAGVASAAVQLAKARGARVTALTSASKLKIMEEHSCADKVGQHMWQGQWGSICSRRSICSVSGAAYVAGAAYAVSVGQNRWQQNRWQCQGQHVCQCQGSICASGSGVARQAESSARYTACGVVMLDGMIQ